MPCKYVPSGVWPLPVAKYPSVSNAAILSRRLPSNVWPPSVRNHIQTTTSAPTPCKDLVRYYPRPGTSAFSQRLHPWEWPSNTRSKANQSAKMGRSGYDTTNMKVAKNPRPAASASLKPKDDTTDKKKKNKQQPQSQPQAPAPSAPAPQPKGPYPPGRYGNESLGE